MYLRLHGRAFFVAMLILVSTLNLTSSVNSQATHQIPVQTPLQFVAPSMPLPTIGYAPKTVPLSGILHVLVIAVAFSDVNYSLSVTQIKKRWLGTVSAYYHEVSYGTLTIEGEVHGWYKLPYPEAHYGRNCRGINDPDCSGINQSWHIAEDAVPLAEKDVDFSHFDYFVFIHSGNGQETSRMMNDVWSVTYLGASIKTDTTTLTRFNIVPELETPPNVPNGVWCVEFAHNLGVPDLYNTANGPSNSKPILGPWELMDKGSWNGDPPGSLPAHMTAWPKMQLGFINGTRVATVDSGVSLTLTVDPTEIASNNVHAIKIPVGNEVNSTQYYLVEVRRQTGFDAALPEAGVLITSVNESATIGKVRVMNGDPGVADLEDAIWKVHQAFNDRQHNLTITVMGKIGDAYQVRVLNGISTSPAIGHGITWETSGGSTETHIRIAGVLLSVEIARNASTQTEGLSGRTHLDDGSGMLFVFGHEDYWSFWMLDMKFPLDIIWFNSNRQAVWIEPNIQPCSPMNCPELTPESQAMYVLEVNAGLVATNQISLGATFAFDNT
jgi:M6 family metalloprotease-like protein